MTALCETSGAAPARCSGPSPARALDEPPAVELERERVRDPDALMRERRAPEPRERCAGQLHPITPNRAAQNLRRLATALHDADPRTRKKG
jgi:hypothetical protein